MKTFALYFSLTLSIVFLFEGCKKDRQQRAFYAPINTYINITLPKYDALRVPGGWAYVNGGKQGIIVYAKGGNEFVAFDRNCTYNEDNPCGKASVDSDNITVECSCDGSTYNIFDGTVTNNPAEFPLYQYRTSFNSTNNQLRIYN